MWSCLFRMAGSLITMAANLLFKRLAAIIVFIRLLLLELHHHQHGVIVLLQALGNGLQFAAQLARFKGFDEVESFELYGCTSMYLFAESQFAFLHRRIVLVMNFG